MLTYEVGDHTIPLTPLGHQQAHQAGRRIGADFLDGALAYCSTFRRARETMAGVLAGAGAQPGTVRVFEDPRLREVEHGYVDAEPQKDLRKTHGYRFNGGESPADCYDRTSAFLESMMRQAARKQAQRVMVVTHSLLRDARSAPEGRGLRPHGRAGERRGGHAGAPRHAGRAGVHLGPLGRGGPAPAPGIGGGGRPARGPLTGQASLARPV